MEYSVKVTLSSGMEIPFIYNGPAGGPKDIKNHLLNSLTGEWHYFENSWGEGYFKKSEIIAIVVKKK